MKEERDRIVFLFPGQGSQHLSMGKEIYKEYPAAREVYDLADRLLGYDFKNICFEGSVGKLNNIEAMFPAIFTFGCASFRIFMNEIGMAPAFLAGHSLGEFTALTCSGAVGFEEALSLVHKRACFVNEVFQTDVGHMSVVENCDYDFAERMIRQKYGTGRVSVSCYNNHEQIVISGDRETLFQAEDLLRSYNAKVTPLFISPPMHSHYMEPAARKLKEELKNISFQLPQWPVISNVTARPYESSDEIKENLVAQITKPVKWLQSMLFLLDKSISIYIDMGPQSIIHQLIPDSSIPVIAMGKKEDRNRLFVHYRIHKKIDSKKLMGATALGEDFINRCLVTAVSTKNSNWNEDEYRAGVIESYEELERIEAEVEKNNGMISGSQTGKARELLDKILTAKKIPESEKHRLLEQV